MAQSTKLIGILTDVFPVETFQSGFAKRIIWVKQPDTERYPEHWQMELHNSDVTQIDRFRPGDKLEVEVEIRGKKWEKYTYKLIERLPPITSRRTR
jgi:hypothetical protein